MMNDYTKTAAILFLMWFAPHCSENKRQPAKTVDAGIALAVQEDVLKFAIERRLGALEAVTMQAATTAPTPPKIQAVTASEAVRQ